MCKHKGSNASFGLIWFGFDLVLVWFGFLVQTLSLGMGNMCAKFGSSSVSVMAQMLVLV